MAVVIAKKGEDMTADHIKNAIDHVTWMIGVLPQYPSDFDDSDSLEYINQRLASMRDDMTRHLSWIVKVMERTRQTLERKEKRVAPTKMHKKTSSK